MSIASTISPLPVSPKGGAIATGSSSSRIGSPRRQVFSRNSNNMVIKPLLQITNTNTALNNSHEYELNAVHEHNKDQEYS